MPLSWYAVYTRPRYEKKVANLFLRKQIENYCPLNKEIHQWRDRKKTILTPLFTSYVFVRVNECQLPEVKSTEGVINIVHWLKKPAVIKDCEIEAIRSFLKSHEFVQLHGTTINLNDVVRITSGPLRDEKGTVISLQKNYVKLNLPSLGFAMVAEVAKSHVELISTHSGIATKINSKRYAFEKQDIHSRP